MLLTLLVHIILCLKLQFKNVSFHIQFIYVEPSYSILQCHQCLQTKPHASLEKLMCLNLEETCYCEFHCECNLQHSNTGTHIQNHTDAGLELRFMLISCIRMGVKCDRSDFDIVWRGMNLGARLAGFSISETAGLLAISHPAFSRAYRE